VEGIGDRVVSALHSMSTEDLVGLCATLDELKFEVLMGSTISRLFSRLFKGRSQSGAQVGSVEDEVARVLADAIRVRAGKYSQMPREWLVDHAWNSMCDRLALDAVERKDINTAARRMFEAVAEGYSLHDYRALSDGELVDRVSRRVVMGLLEDLKAKMDKLPECEKQKKLEEITRAIDCLPQKQKHIVLRDFEQAGAKTVREIASVLVRGGLTLTMLESMGFGIYVAISTVLHTVFTRFLGITLPFVVYGAASWITSVLLGPLGWLMIAAAGLWKHIKEQRSFNRKVLGTALVQVLAAMPQET